MRYLEIWNLINEHFRKLLGKSLEVIDEIEEIPPVFENVHLKDDIFTL